MVNKNQILKEIQEKGQKQVKNRGLIAIQAQKEIILEAIEQGATLKVIHSVLEERGLMPVKYAAFARLVKKHLKQPSEAQIVPPKTKVSAPKKPKSYAYNPDEIDIDDLK